MNLLSAATKLYNQCFQRIDDRPGKMTLSQAFATKLHHDRISPRTESKLLSVFNATLFETSQCRTTQARIDTTRKQLDSAMKSVNEMDASKAKHSLFAIAKVMAERTTTAQDALNKQIIALAPHQGTLADAIRQYHDAEITREIGDGIVNFARMRYLMFDRPANTAAARADVKYREQNDCPGLDVAERELGQAMGELDEVSTKQAYWPLKLVLDEIKSEIEDDAKHWRGMTHAAYAGAQPHEVALLGTRILGSTSTTTQLVKHYRPELLEQFSSDSSDSDTRSSTWSLSTDRSHR
ncbi:hypothetical protein [Stenotrophomonas oahuensis]|uniref:Uncharacterized protein n=1 Tax=Stenotrophomonas oahuensis TaxID=3003271 RepID=A0ABY9YJ56_9GAMM|nr:hypothetical protein [Stenotrophomonas sp. A5586]WNH50920.1 hypothetical protein PDM29_11010 [Stenotrophomonas sp. A5586]